MIVVIVRFFVASVGYIFAGVGFIVCLGGFYGGDVIVGVIGIIVFIIGMILYSIL